MPPTRRSRSYNDSETPIAELTSGQLVIGICVALFVALTCFLAGVLLGKRDPSFREAARPPISEAESALEGTQLSPRPNVLDSRGPAAEIDPYTSPGERSGPRVTDVRPPAPGESPSTPTRINRVADTAAPTPPERPVTMTTPDTPVEVASATPTPPPPPPRETPATSGPVALRGSEPPAESSPAPAPAPAPAPTPAPAQPTPTETAPQPAPAPTQPVSLQPSTPQQQAAPSATGHGAFGIQVASFMGADRASRSEEERRRVSQETGLPAAVFPSQDGSIHRVLIVGYPDRPSATAATQDLRKRSNYADAFVKALD